MSIAHPRTEFVRVTKTDNTVFACRADRLLSILGPEGDKRHTTIAVQNGQNVLKFAVLESPDEIGGIYARFQGRGGGVVKVRPDFIAAVEESKEEGATRLHIAFSASSSQSFFIKENVDEALERIDNALSMLP